MQYLPLYTSEQARRHEVRPGLTGWAQSHGRNALSWDDRFKLDVWYVDHQSLGLDLEILARTVLLVLRGDGVNSPGAVSGAVFRGPGRVGEIPPAAIVGDKHRLDTVSPGVAAT
jgi:sugar transferase EpsL